MIRVVVGVKNNDDVDVGGCNLKVYISDEVLGVVITEVPEPFSEIVKLGLNAGDGIFEIDQKISDEQGRLISEWKNRPASSTSEDAINLIDAESEGRILPGVSVDETKLWYDAAEGCVSSVDRKDFRIFLVID